MGGSKVFRKRKRAPPSGAPKGTRKKQEGYFRCLRQRRENYLTKTDAAIGTVTTGPANAEPAAAPTTAEHQAIRIERTSQSTGLLVEWLTSGPEKPAEEADVLGKSHNSREEIHLHHIVV